MGKSTSPCISGQNYTRDLNKNKQIKNHKKKKRVEGEKNPQTTKQRCKTFNWFQRTCALVTVLYVILQKLKIILDMCKVEPLQAGHKIKSWSEMTEVTKSSIQWRIVNLQVRMKIPLILYKHLYKDDWAMDRNWGNSLIYALPLIFEIWPNLTWILAKRFLKRMGFYRGICHCKHLEIPKIYSSTALGGKKNKQTNC